MVDPPSGKETGLYREGCPMLLRSDGATEGAYPGAKEGRFPMAGKPKLAMLIARPLGWRNPDCEAILMILLPFPNACFGSAAHTVAAVEKFAVEAPRFVAVADENGDQLACRIRPFGPSGEPFQALDSSGQKQEDIPFHLVHWGCPALLLSLFPRPQ
ncbi:hypothetical protein E6O75_ATG00121 [Venturia nashicola]|uniref:Uncharacterized protein n=1 Tax=Venturia nashicola TaxID=86259 RepID=A0A4Z1PMV6_9PEZI|nr:hypothetical protein E6O75_ATG00121 [Venturia nashicola]